MKQPKIDQYTAYINTSLYYDNIIFLWKIDFGEGNLQPEGHHIKLFSSCLLWK